MALIDSVRSTWRREPKAGYSSPLKLLAMYGSALYIADVFIGYLRFKFAANNPLFSKLEGSLGLDWIEPHFRHATGGLEALAVILLFIPGLQVAGAALSFGIMTGAIATHLFTAVGIDPFNDGGTLFRQAVTIWLLSAGIVAIRRREILPLLRSFLRDRVLNG